jgi:hypothetical protein
LGWFNNGLRIRLVGSAGRYWSSFGFTRPNQASVLFINHGVSEKQLVLEIIEVGVIEAEPSPQSTIGHFSLALEQVESLSKNTVEVHNGLLRRGMARLA